MFLKDCFALNHKNVVSFSGKQYSWRYTQNCFNFFQNVGELPPKNTTLLLFHNSILIYVSDRFFYAKFKKFGFNICKCIFQEICVKLDFHQNVVQWLRKPLRKVAVASSIPRDHNFFQTIFKKIHI